MAGVEPALNGTAPAVKFALADAECPVVESASEEGIGETPSRSTSRFQVAKVEVENETLPPASAEDSEQAQRDPHEGIVVNGDDSAPPSDNTCGNTDDSTEQVPDEHKTAKPKAKPPPPIGVVFSDCMSLSDTSTSPPITADGQSFTYDTHNLKTFGHNTLETLPHLDHYRNILSTTGAMRKRPTLMELHEQDKEEEYHLLEGHENGTTPKVTGTTEEVKPAPTAVKFGWITGVLVRCLLNIYGVMLFLRLSWVVGQAGIGLSAVIVLLAAVVTTITALSMSAICTNGQVKGGGAYFMISRSLGPEFGGAIGIVFSMANAVAVAMYIVGFAETIRDVLKSYDRLMVDEINDVRIIGLITLCAVLSIALIGMEWESKAQLILLGILLLAIGNFVIGSFIPPSEGRQSKGFVGYRGDLFKANFGPDFRDGYNFFSVFAIFFPAATGILAGANISGDLADAQVAIPKGTLLAILISMLTYIAMSWMAGAVVLRDATGGAISNITSMFAYNSSRDVYACDTRLTDCPYGLQNDMQVMQVVSLFGPLTIAGIISATLSSALASMVSAPKVFQAVCKDKIFPGIQVFAKSYGPNEEPRRAYFLTFGIAFACIAIGQLNAIAPLISNFFLMSYALINYSCFDASLAKSPGWRPAFRYYSMWLSLLGAVICLGVMFTISWINALLTLAVVTALYIFVHYRKPDINWGSSTQAHVYRNALQHALKLTSVLEHIKNFRPQILVMSGFPSERPAVVDFASTLTKNISLMICGHIMQGEPSDKLHDAGSLSGRAYAWLSKRKVKAFYVAVTANNLRSGAQSLLQCTGMGKLRPNTLLIGFMSRWRTAKREEVEDYFKVIHDAFDMRCGVGILRMPDGLQCQQTELPETIPDEAVQFEECDPLGDQQGASGDNEQTQVELGVTKVRFDNSSYQEEEDEDETQQPQPASAGGDAAVTVETDEKTVQFAKLSPDGDMFYKKQHGTIDVWWLFDDGGLTLLIPYILSTKPRWQNCKLRVFMAGTKTMELDSNQRHLATMLSKFRIEYSSMTVVPDIGKKVSAERYNQFKEGLSGWTLREDEGETEEEFPWKVTESELSMQKEKTYRHLRLQELLQEYSSDATLIVMTLPMPRKGLVSAGLYMAWLDVLSQGESPILLLRGNQTSVLTFYS